MERTNEKLASNKRKRDRLDKRRAVVWSEIERLWDMEELYGGLTFEEASVGDSAIAGEHLRIDQYNERNVQLLLRRTMLYDRIQMLFDMIRMLCSMV